MGKATGNTTALGSSVTTTSYNLTGLSADCLPARGIAIDDRVDGYRFLGSIAVEAGGASPFTTPALRADGADGLFCPGQPRILRLAESCM